LPYGAQAQSDSPFGGQAQSDSPFGAQPQSGSPFGAQAQSGGSPFGARPDEEPFGARPDSSFEAQPAFGAHPSSPYDAAPPGSPYDAPQPGSPYDAVPQTSPFESQQGSPYGGQPSSPFEGQSGSPYEEQAGQQSASPFGARPDDQPFGARPDDNSPFGARPDDNSPFGAGPPASPFGPRPDGQTSPFDAQPGSPFGPRPSGDQSPPGIARASASARVALPGPQPGGPQSSGPPHAEFVDRGPEQFSEMTTDIAGRGGDPGYVPAAALPAMPPGLEGGFGPNVSQGNRATVTPPGPDDTTSWPGPDPNGFDQFKPPEEAPPAKPETPHVRMFPILVAVVAGAALLLAIVFGIVFLAAGGKDDNQAAIKQGECVKQDGSKAVKVDCTDATAFQVVSIVADKSKCDDAKQPVVVSKADDGTSQVLCLKPNK
jgi:hypothetical protein